MPELDTTETETATPDDTEKLPKIDQDGFPIDPHKLPDELRVKQRQFYMHDRDYATFARLCREALPEDMRRQKLSRPRVITEWLRFLVSDHRAAERLAKGEE